MTLKITLDQYVFSSWRTLFDIKKHLTTTWDVTLKTSYPTFYDFTTKEKIKNVNILHECKESRDVDCLLKTSIEDNIDEDNKDVTLIHPLYDDEFKCTKEKDIQNILVQQNDINKEYNHENIEIEYMLCNASTTCYVFEITKT